MLAALKVPGAEVLMPMAFIANYSHRSWIPYVVDPNLYGFPHELTTPWLLAFLDMSDVQAQHNSEEWRYAHLDYGAREYFRFPSSPHWTVSQARGG